MVVIATTLPILSGNEILHLITNLGLKKVTEIRASNINDPICKAHGWKKRSIFWDFPYWSTLLIRHNLDVMDIEKNVFENVFNMVMNVPGKTKDTFKSRYELNEYCLHQQLEKVEGMTKYPKACYTLDKIEKQVLCEWVINLRYPDGYASNLARCVDMQKLKLFGMKSYDCPVFMQRLLLVAFHELLP